MRNLSNGLRISLVGAWFVFTGYWLPQLWLAGSAVSSMASSMPLTSLHHESPSVRPSFFWLAPESASLPFKGHIEPRFRLLEGHEGHKWPFSVAVLSVAFIGILAWLSRYFQRLWRFDPSIWWMLFWRGCCYRISGWKSSNCLYCQLKTFPSLC